MIKTLVPSIKRNDFRVISNELDKRCEILKIKEAKSEVNFESTSPP